jgi:hypothetical protein
MFKHFIEHWLPRSLRRLTDSRPARRSRTRRNRPSLEELECRCLPSTVYWTNASGGDWSIPGKVLDECTLANSQTATWTAGNILMRDGAIVNNLAGATFMAQGNTTSLVNELIGASPTFNNAGTFRKVAHNGPTAIGVTFNNTGLVDVAFNSSLTLSGGGNATGTFNVDFPATLDFGGGTFTLSAASPISGIGTVSFTGGVVDILGTYSSSGTTSVAGGTVDFVANASMNHLNLGGGDLTGPGNVTVSSMFSWTGGTMSGTGRTTANGALDISQANDKTLDGRTLDIARTATWGQGNLVMTNRAVINNLAGATFDAEADGFLGASNMPHCRR